MGVLLLSLDGEGGEVVDRARLRVGCWFMV
jgi:hypothetical protein